MNKLSAAQFNHILIKTAEQLEQQQAYIQHLEQQLAGHARQQHAEKVASMAVDRGIVSPDDEEAYAAKLARGEDDLALVEDFVQRSVSGLPLGADGELSKSASVAGGEGGDAISSFLLSSDLIHPA